MSGKRLREGVRKKGFRPGVGDGLGDRKKGNGSERDGKVSDSFELGSAKIVIFWEQIEQLLLRDLCS